MQMPLRRFWFLLNQIPRLRAEDGLQQLQIVAAAGSADGYKAMAQQFENLIGPVFVSRPVAASTEVSIETANKLDPEFDRAGLLALKAKHTSQRKHR